MSTKQFKELTELGKHKVVWLVVQQKIRQSDFTKLQWQKLLEIKD